MEKIFKHRRDPIDSLKVVLRDTENNLLSKKWTTALFDPFEQYESHFAPPESRDVVTALHQARTRFGVKVDLSKRIDSMLLRHSEYLPDTDSPRRGNVQPSAAKRQQPVEPAAPGLRKRLSCRLISESSAAVQPGN